MSNYEKLIKQATKPKPGAPKAKYIDPIIASSFSQDGSLQEICRAISGRLSDNNSLVVFRSLIVIHTLIRNGGIDNVMSHLAGNQSTLKLRNVVAGGNWQGYDAPKMLAPYAAYLDERIKAYRDTRRDPIRATVSGIGGRTSSEGSSSGQRLRRLTVEKGVLREVAIAQKVCSRLLDLFFAYFSDNTSEEMAMTAFRMALKDLLAIYAAINEGVINILEHYFEMAKSDAGRALDIYKRFCSHTEKIVAYLANAKKMSYSLNIPIPTLRHAPISLAGALKEYLDDPNFEQNRQEYKENRRVADSGGTPATKVVPSATPKQDETKKGSITIKEPSAEEKTKPVKLPTSNAALQDFFESIETDQLSMFGGAQQQQQMQMQMQIQQQQQLQPYMTGLPQMVPQQTGYNPFMNGMNGGGSFMMPQQTGYMPMQQNGFMQPQQTGFLQPQMTGFNPFRQNSMPQPLEMNNEITPPFQHNGAPTGMTTAANNAGVNAGLGSSNSPFAPSTTIAAPTPSFLQQAPPTRSASTPIKPLVAQKTGSRNPFAPPPGETPPPTPPPAGPKGPTLRDLAMGGMGSAQGPSTGGGGNYGLGAGAWAGNADSQEQQQQQQSSSSQLMPQKTGLIGSIASEFVKGLPVSSNGNGTSTPQTFAQSPAPTAASNTNDFNSSFAALSFQNGQAPTSQTPLQAQPTGFGGVKPFQPSSTFGATLMTPQPPVLSPNMTGNPFANMLSSPGPSQPPAAATNGASNGSSLFSSNGGPPQQQSTSSAFLSSQPTGYGSTLFGGGNSVTPSSNGINPQPTGYGSSMFGVNGASSLAAQPIGMGGSSVKPFQPSSAFGSAAFGSQLPQQQSQEQQRTDNNAFSGSLF
ncbi:hypothetical protein CBS101457_005810 [Exobasidium rhododendri]|nr:hypothetical protein CBS101457_005810 [Exobasidium rhododendri]